MNREELISKLKDLLQDVQAAYLFGSYARGEADEFSDLDIMVVKDTGQDFFHRFKEFPELYELGMGVDLLVYMPEEFRKMEDEDNLFIARILEEGVRIV